MVQSDVVIRVAGFLPHSRQKRVCICVRMSGGHLAGKEPRTSDPLEEKERMRMIYGFH